MPWYTVLAQYIRVTKLLQHRNMSLLQCRHGDAGLDLVTQLQSPVTTALGDQGKGRGGGGGGFGHSGKHNYALLHASAIVAEIDQPMWIGPLNTCIKVTTLSAMHCCQCSFTDLLEWTLVETTPPGQTSNIPQACQTRGVSVGALQQLPGSSPCLCHMST